MHNSISFNAISSDAMHSQNPSESPLPHSEISTDIRQTFLTAKCKTPQRMMYMELPARPGVMSTFPRHGPMLNPHHLRRLHFFVENRTRNSFANRPPRETALPNLDTLQKFLILRTNLQTRPGPAGWSSQYSATQGLGALDLPLNSFHPAYPVPGSWRSGIE